MTRHRKVSLRIHIHPTVRTCSQSTHSSIMLWLYSIWKYIIINKITNNRTNFNILYRNPVYVSRNFVITFHRKYIYLCLYCEKSRKILCLRDMSLVKKSRVVMLMHDAYRFSIKKLSPTPAWAIGSRCSDRRSIHIARPQTTRHALCICGLRVAVCPQPLSFECHTYGGYARSDILTLGHCWQARWRHRWKKYSKS